MHRKYAGKVPVDTKPIELKTKKSPVAISWKRCLNWICTAAALFKPALTVAHLITKCASTAWSLFQSLINPLV